MRWDAAVVGAGVVGLAVARALARRGRSVLVLEKEPALAAHQSGRNSGVVHAGFSYKPGSLKARFSVAGGKALRAFAAEHGVALRDVGKVVVAQRPAEVEVLERYLAQGKANGVPGLRLLDGKELAEVEPHAAGIAALHSPASAIVDAHALLEALARDARAAGAELALGEPLRGAARRGAWELRTPGGVHEASALVTCAGLQSDRVARACGLLHPYRVVPFRGSYYRLRPGREGLVRGLVYPVPDPRFPFLGVHFTPRTDGSCLVGPSALLALDREGYRHPLQARARDLASMAGYRGFWRMAARPEVRSQAGHEALRAMRPARYAADARALVPALRDGDLVPSHHGIRAQLVAPDGSFVDDLLVQASPGAVHVLNAVSPGLTSSLAFAEHVAEQALAAGA